MSVSLHSISDVSSKLSRGVVVRKSHNNKLEDIEAPYSSRERKKTMLMRENLATEESW